MIDSECKMVMALIKKLATPANNQRLSTDDQRLMAIDQRLSTNDQRLTTN